MNESKKNNQKFDSLGPSKLKAHAPHVYTKFESSKTSSVDKADETWDLPAAIESLGTWMDEELDKLVDDYADFVTVNSSKRDMNR